MTRATREPGTTPTDAAAGEAGEDRDGTSWTAYPIEDAEPRAGAGGGDDDRDDEALGVATVEVGNGADPVVRSFAREVLTFQSYEVGVMRQTLSDWGYSTADRPDEAMAWMGMEPVPVEEMPGYLSDEGLESMTQAEGSEADELFLELMADHHRGGLHMAVEAAERASDDGVRNLAETMVRNQAHEIEEYRQWALDHDYDVEIAPPEAPADML